jgi:curved DNA-binding protein CbpA
MVDSVPNRPAPTANGTLAKTPLVHLVLYALDKKLTGTLELLAPDKKSATITLSAGLPTKVRTSEQVAYLGRVLLELGHLTEEQLTKSLADLAKEKTTGMRLHGELLVGRGLIDERKLRDGLREQIARKLRQAAGMPPETAYGYFDGFDALQNYGRAAVEGVDPYPGLWAMVREFPPWPHVQAALDKTAASPLRLRGTDLARLGLAGEELAAVELLRARPLRTQDLARAAHLNERTAQLLVYLLLVTKQVEVLPPDAAQASSLPPPSPAAARAGAQRLSRPPTPSPAGFKPSSAPLAAAAVSRPPSAPSPAAVAFKPPAAPSPVPPAPAGARSSAKIGVSPPAGGRITVPPLPAGLPAELAERWKEIGERASTIDRADYFSMLDIARDATTEEVESAYFALAKQWHPDRLPQELAPVRDLCARVFGRMSEARATLVDGQQRERYMKLLADGSGSPEMQETVARVVEAATNFQKADICFKRSDLVQAETFCRKALELDDTQPDYHALLAWLIAQKPESQSPEATQACIARLDRAIGISNRCEKAYYWRGLLYKRLGKKDLAARDFKKVAELNPKNIDAAREVRLDQMRSSGRASSPPAPPVREGSKAEESKGLFGKLFKK